MLNGESLKVLSVFKVNTSYIILWKSFRTLRQVNGNVMNHRDYLGKKFNYTCVDGEDLIRKNNSKMITEKVWINVA